MEVFRLSASEAQRLLKSNELTVESYAQSLLSRIDERDATVHAWVYLNRDAVLEEARKLDAIPVEKRGPLHGVPIGVKDVIYTKDMPTEHNSPLYKDSHIPVDAASVAIFRSAGALIFGKTSTTEFAATTIGPPTTNPHDPTRTPGGSSSGSGAAVADFQVPISLGTQTGGSTIRPGSFNGIYALKPTWGAISREGQKIYSLTLDTLGIFARSVEDLRLLGGVLGVRDDSAETGLEIKGKRFGMVKGPVWDKAGLGTINAMAKAKELLEAHGAAVDEVTLPSEFNKVPGWHSKIMTCDGRTAFLSEYARDKTLIHPSLIEHVENSTGLTHKQELEAFDGVAALRPRIDEIANEYAALITPSVPDEAPLGQESTGSAAFNGMWTALHVPVINVPGFKGENGMPVGVSLVAARHRDEHLLDVAGVVGDVFERDGGWKSAL